MRPSSVFLFVAFALLASPSPINDDSRRSNSLPVRCEPYDPIVYRVDDMVIQFKFKKDGLVEESIVTFGKDKTPVGHPSNKPITFYPPEEVPSGKPRPIFISSIVRDKPWAVVLDYFMGPQRKSNEIVLTFMKSDIGWRAFIHSTYGEWKATFRHSTNRPSENGGHIFTVNDIGDGEFIQHLNHGEKQVMMRVNARHENGAWEYRTMLHNFQAVEWLPLPHIICMQV